MKSISSNGPIRNPPSSRIAQSIVGDVGDAFLEDAKRFAVERTRDAIDDEARRVASRAPASSSTLASARARRVDDVGVAADPRHDLDERHHRRRIEEVDADDALRVLARRRDRRDRERRRVRREHARRARTTLSSARNSARFAPRSSTIASMTRPHVAIRARRRRRASPRRSRCAPSSASAASRLDAPLLDLALQRLRDVRRARFAVAPSHARRRARRDGPAAAATCAMPAAHRAGADDADDQLSLELATYRPLNTGFRFSRNACTPSA